MRQRFITGIIGAAIMVPIIMSNSLIVNIAVAMFSFFVLFELYTAVGLSKNIFLFLLGLCSSFLFTFGSVEHAEFVLQFIFLYIFGLFLCYLSFHKTIPLGDISIVYFLTMYVGYCLATIVFVRKMQGGNFYIWLIFIGAWCTDIFAYLAGKTFGKHKLCPTLSPKKTIEGAVGGVLGCLAVLFVFGKIIQTFSDHNVNYILLCILAIILSVMSQLGDLAASAIKRQYNIKDYGNIMPGHGGLMDRCDSVLFAAPTVYVFLLHWGNLLFISN